MTYRFVRTVVARGRMVTSTVNVDAPSVGDAEKMLPADAGWQPAGRDGAPDAFTKGMMIGGIRRSADPDGPSLMGKRPSERAPG